jgi:hypothetical protein
LDLENQRNFLEDFGKKHGIEKMEDWYQITSFQMKNHPGGSTLLQLYNDFLYKLLARIYPHHEWLPWRFKHVPLLFWKE